MRTQVAIIGAGPAGLMLGQLLQRAGIENVVLERQSREHVESRVRAGVLEPGTVDGLVAAGVGERLAREGLVHDGFDLRFKGQSHRIDIKRLAERSITIYPQQELVKDLIKARLAARAPLHFECEEVRISAIDGTRARVAWQSPAGEGKLECDFVAGCDGSHGVSRSAVPPTAMRTFERHYPYAWLGILAQAKPTRDVLVYTHHERGFALFSMRSKSLTRLYLQVAPDEDLAKWPDERIWKELDQRFKGEDGWKPAHGKILEKGIVNMRSAVTEPLRFRRLFLLGDAAHVVPPTGAKGLNLALGDAQLLSWCLVKHYKERVKWALDVYSGPAIHHAWRAQQFSCFMTRLLHRDPAGDEFEQRTQLARLTHFSESRTAATALAESYAGPPFFSDPRGNDPW